MKSLLAALALTCGPALADGGVTVALPDLSQNPIEELEGFLPGLVLAIVLAQNCPNITVTEGELALLSGSADLIAARLKLSVADYEDRFWTPAFDRVAEPDACQIEQYEVAIKLGMLTGAGGGTTPLK